MRCQDCSVFPPCLLFVSRRLHVYRLHVYRGPDIVHWSCNASQVARCIASNGQSVYTPPVSPMALGPRRTPPHAASHTATCSTWPIARMRPIGRIGGRCSRRTSCSSRWRRSSKRARVRRPIFFPGSAAVAFGCQHRHRPHPCRSIARRKRLRVAKRCARRRACAAVRPAAYRRAHQGL